MGVRIYRRLLNEFRLERSKRSQLRFLLLWNVGDGIARPPRDLKYLRLRSLELVLDIELNLFDGGMNHATAALAFLNFKTETVQCADLFGGRFINRLVDSPRLLP